MQSSDRETVAHFSGSFQRRMLQALEGLLDIVDWLGKVLDFVARYSWAVMVATAFVLFMPDEAAEQIGITRIREEYEGFLWIGLILTAAIWVSAVFRYLDQKLSAWLLTRGEQKKMAERAEAETQKIIARLDSLGGKEKLWLKYCLFHNTQTLSAQRSDTVAQSLVFKGIVMEGSGHLLDLPFHIHDEVWLHLKTHTEKYLPVEDIQNPAFEGLLSDFRRGRHAF